MSSFDINSLLDEIIQNPDKPVDLDRDQVVEVQKKSNLYGVVVPDEIRWINMSIINWREKYLQKLIATGLVGYLFRVHDEYLRAEHSEVEMPESIYKAFGAAPPTDKAQREKMDVAYRNAVKEELTAFLKHNFDYNPDLHVRCAYKDNLEDPERVGKFEQFTAAMKNSSTAASAETPTQPLTSQQVLDAAAATYSRCREAERVLRVFATNAINTGLNLDEEAKASLLRAEIDLRDTAALMYPHVIGRVEGPTKWFPPADVFHHFDRYLSNHFELLREVTHMLYNEKPDIEFAVQFYDRAFESDEEAIKERAKIQDRVTASVLTISNEGWYMLGPFKKNRERIDFYNKNTEILKRMSEQNEMDTKLGKDLMEKRVRRQKNRNIIEAGPDDPGLAKYKDALVTLDTLGAKAVLTDEVKEKMAEAMRRKEMTEVPPDSIQVDVHRPVEQPDGSTKLVRDKFYTASEAPEFMTDNLASQRKMVVAINEGENPREAFNQMVKETTQIKSRDGKISTLRDLANNIKPKN